MPLNLRIKAEDVQRNDRVRVCPNPPSKREWGQATYVEPLGERFVNIHVSHSNTYLCIERDAEIEVVR
jgi:hypothetical protein